MCIVIYQLQALLFIQCIQYIYRKHLFHYYHYHAPLIPTIIVLFKYSRIDISWIKNDVYTYD